MKVVSLKVPLDLMDFLVSYLDEDITTGATLTNDTKAWFEANKKAMDENVKKEIQEDITENEEMLSTLKKIQEILVSQRGNYRVVRKKE